MTPTPPLSTRIASMFALDEKRTPGEWIAGCHPANERLNIVKPIFFGKYVGKLPDCEGGAMYMLHKPNAEYIAAMPEAISVIREQQDLLALAVDALTILHGDMICLKSVAPADMVTKIGNYIGVGGEALTKLKDAGYE